LIKEEIEWFKSKGVILKIMNMPTTLIQIDGQEWVIEMINNIILEVLSTLAQQEHEDIVRRTKEGLEATRSRGTKLGKDAIDMGLVNKCHELVSNGISVSEACRTVGIGRTTYYKYI
jgi:DNA invertase Pin-like site-specific DNA recombinase